MGWKADTVTKADECALEQLLRLGPYFTDNVRLFRLTSVVTGSSGPKFVQLEDCRSLHVSEHAAEEVMLLGLVPVNGCLGPEAAGGSDSAFAPRHGKDRRRAATHQP